MWKKTLVTDGIANFLLNPSSVAVTTEKITDPFYRSILFHVGQKPEMINTLPLDSYRVYYMPKKEDGIQPMDVNITDNVFINFLEQYSDPGQFIFNIAVESVTLPTKMIKDAKGNEIMQIYLIVTGLNAPQIIMDDGSPSPFLGVINLNKVQDWHNLKKTDNFVSVPHSANFHHMEAGIRPTYISYNHSDVTDFSLSFQTALGEDVVFETTNNFKPGIFITIEVHNAPPKN